MIKEDEITALRKENKELKEMLEYSNNTILKKIVDKSDFYDSIKEELDNYHKAKKTIDEHNKLLDKIYTMRDNTLDIAQEKYPKLYKEFVRDVYDDNPLDVLRFINALIKEVLGER
jgi:cell fate (sporulation/competence/biofilm development) regulator YlbF (YheA/YmcA/DUF963 family)